MRMNSRNAKEADPQPMDLPAPPRSEPPENVWPHVMPRPELRMAALYLVLAGAWVTCTNYVVRTTLLPDWPVCANGLKALNFLITTTVVLYFVLRRAYRGWRHAEREQWRIMAESGIAFRALSARAESQREAERTRISRELHDQFGQAITGLKLDLRWIENQLEQQDNRALNPVTDRLIEAEEELDRMAASVRSLAADLRPDSLDNLGLNEAMKEEAERFTRRTGIHCEILADGCPKDVPSQVATAAFRIFQEALTNIIRHAGASRVRVECDPQDNGLKFSIADDGKGIHPGLATDATSLGLLGMRERAELLGGNLRVAASEAGGTLITAFLPWNHASS
jgi:signal transduction histidine kinase